MKQITVLLQNEWMDKLLEDGMFNEKEEPAQWVINAEN